MQKLFYTAGICCCRGAGRMNICSRVFLYLFCSLSLPCGGWGVSSPGATAGAQTSADISFIDFEAPEDGSEAENDPQEKPHNCGGDDPSDSQARICKDANYCTAPKASKGPQPGAASPHKNCSNQQTHEGPPEVQGPCPARRRHQTTDQTPYYQPNAASHQQPVAAASVKV